MASLKKISSVGDGRGPFFRGSFGDGGADLGTGTSAAAAAGGVRLEQRAGGQGLVWVLSHATFSWPYRMTPIWPGCDISGPRLLKGVQMKAAPMGLITRHGAFISSLPACDCWLQPAEAQGGRR